MGRGISLLRVYETREKERVLDEENRRVVTDEIPDTLLGVELHGESTRISENERVRNENAKSIVIKETCIRKFMYHAYCRSSLSGTN